MKFRHASSNPRDKPLHGRVFRIVYVFGGLFPNSSANFWLAIAPAVEPDSLRLVRTPFLLGGDGELDRVLWIRSERPRTTRTSAGCGSGRLCSASRRSRPTESSVLETCRCKTPPALLGCEGRGHSSDPHDRSEHLLRPKELRRHAAGTDRLTLEAKPIRPFRALIRTIERDENGMSPTDGFWPEKNLRWNLRLYA